MSGTQSGPMVGYMVPSYGNTYSGSFVSVSGPVIGTTIATTQTGPDSDGFYHVSGAAAFQGSPCFTSATITSSMVSGAYMTVTMTANTGSIVTFGGYLADSTGKTITGAYQVISGTCSGDSGTGSVSHS